MNIHALYHNNQTIIVPFTWVLKMIAKVLIVSKEINAHFCSIIELSPRGEGDNFGSEDNSIKLKTR